MRRSKKFIAISMACLMTAITGCVGNQPVTPTAAPESTKEIVETEAATTDTEAQKEAEAAAKIAERNALAGFELFHADGSINRGGRDVIAENGVVTTNRFEASEAGKKILMDGGNAIDAAVAAGFALGVCEPMMTGLGGGGFMTIHFAETNTDTFIDFREVAPMAATPEMWVIGDDGKVVGNETMEGGKAVGVPGEVAGLLYAIEKYGTKSLEEVMAPAIEIAEKGFLVENNTAKFIDSAYTTLAKCDAAAEIYFNEGMPYTVGEVIKNPDLAETLRRISKEGKDAFYKGEIAEKIVMAVKERGGSMTLNDLADYQVEEIEPVRGSYRGYDIISSPPPSSGGTHVIQSLNILENFDVSSMEVNSPEYMHLFSEVFKMAFADRGKYMGDPKYVDVPMTGLLSKEYAKELAGQIDMEKSQQFAFGNPYNYEHEDTLHFSVADKAGNMVSITKTINGGFGTGIVPAGTGFLLNNEMGDFDAGAGKANSVAGGKKPLSSMSPTIILKDGKPFMVVGSPGGQTIICTVTEVISKVIDSEMDLQEAVDSPRFYDGASMAAYGGATGFVYEASIDKDSIKKLEEMGHLLIEKEAWSQGTTQAIQFMEDGTLRGASDPRADGKAVGY